MTPPPTTRTAAEEREKFLARCTQRQQTGQHGPPSYPCYQRGERCIQCVADQAGEELATPAPDYERLRQQAVEISQILAEHGAEAAPIPESLRRLLERSAPEPREETSYYNEAAKAYEALARIVRAYDRYRGRGVMPAPDEYQGIVSAIDAARSIMGPQFQVGDPPSGPPVSPVSEEADRIAEQEMRADAVEPSAGTSMASFQAQVGETRSRTIRTIVAHPFFALAREFQWDDRQLQAARKLIDITMIRLEELASPAAPPLEREKMMADKTGQVPTDAEVDEDVQRDRKLDHSRANPDGCSHWCRDCEARLSCRNNRHEWPNDYSDGDTCFCGAFYLFANTVDERPHVIQSQAEDR